MKALLRCLVLGTICALLVAAAVLFGARRPVPQVSGAAFWLMYPALWLTDLFFGARIASSSSGLNNFIAMVLASVGLNAVLYSAVFFLSFKVRNLLVQRKQRQTL
jgi:energy-converting hydrogenase Eha subunit F